jgi:protein associated with RNAse G/E
MSPKIKRECGCGCVCAEHTDIIDDIANIIKQLRNWERKLEESSFSRDQVDMWLEKLENYAKD